MPTFKNPVYSKKTNANGQTDASYVFSVEYSDSDDGIGFVADSPEDISVQSIQSCLIENQEWWNHYLQAFLKQSSKFFSKQYTVQNLLKIVRHTLQDVIEINTPTNVILLPKHIQILGGTFIIHWNYTCQPISIDIPGLSDSLPVLNKVVDGVVDGVAELNMNDLPINSTESFELEDPNRLYEKQKVKEAILRAKVAYYKAQNQIRTFSDKYGEEYSSEFELEDTENESEEEEEDEEEDEEKEEDN